MKKLLLTFLGPLLVVLLVGAAYIHFVGDQRYDAPYPDIEAVDDPQVIDHGRYLVFGPAHCASCHVPREDVAAVNRGEVVPLIGGWNEEILPASLHAPNITPDPETGIGNLTDAEIARALRYNIGHDGRLILPVKRFHQVSDEDLTAIISFLRSQEPVRHEVPASSYSFLGKALQTFDVLEPQSLDKEPPKAVERVAGIEYGRYMASTVANCMGCHTEVDPLAAELVKPPYSGGFVFPASDWTHGYTFVAPNLTPDPDTGIMAHWSEEQFRQRMKAGEQLRGSPMPWGPFSRMDSTDVIAIYRFLQSLDAVENPIERTAYGPEEKVPE